MGQGQGLQPCPALEPIPNECDWGGTRPQAPMTSSSGRPGDQRLLSHAAPAGTPHRTGHPWRGSAQRPAPTADAAPSTPEVRPMPGGPGCLQALERRPWWPGLQACVGAAALGAPRSEKGKAWFGGVESTGRAAGWGEKDLFGCRGCGRAGAWPRSGYSSGHWPARMLSTLEEGPGRQSVLGSKAQDTGALCVAGSRLLGAGHTWPWC